MLRLRCGTSDVDEARMGWLCVHKGQAITLALLAPKPGDEKSAAGDAGEGAGEPSATDLFAEGGPDPEDDADTEGGEPDAGTGEPVRGEGWPFPQGGSELSDFERSRRAAAGEQPPQDATHEPLPKRRGKGNGAAATH